MRGIIRGKSVRSPKRTVATNRLIEVRILLEIKPLRNPEEFVVGSKPERSPHTDQNQETCFNSEEIEEFLYSESRVARKQDKARHHSENFIKNANIAFRRRGPFDAQSGVAYL